LAKCNQIGVGGFVQPAAVFDELAAEIPKMGNRTAEGSKAELEKCRKDLTDATPDRHRAHQNARALDVSPSSPRR
jgi:hypothetical protein